MGHRPDNPAGDAPRAGARAAAGRRPAHAGAAPRRGGRRPRDRASLPGLGHHQGCVRVPGADGGALRRNAPDDVGRNGPGRGRLDHPRRAHEGVAGSPRPALGAGARDPARRTETEQWHRPGVPQSARETTSQDDAIEIDQGTRHRRRAAWVPVELSGLAGGANEYAS